MASFLLELNNRRTVIKEIGDLDVNSDSLWRLAVIYVLPLFRIGMGGDRFKEIPPFECQYYLAHLRF